jgi:hypothetical protein
LVGAAPHIGAPIGSRRDLRGVGRVKPARFDTDIGDHRFALTSLPHKPQQSTTWRRESHNLTLVLQAGVDRNEKSLGAPYGSYARFILLFLQSEAIGTGFILLFLQSEAIGTGSREVELGRSMRVWLGSKMGLSLGGMTYKNVSEQAISGSSLTFFADRNGAQIKAAAAL